MRKKIRTIKILILIILVIGGGFGYYHSRFIAPDDYTIKRTTISNSNLPNESINIHIGFISDIILKNSEDITILEKIISSLIKQHAEVIIFVRDL